MLRLTDDMNPIEQEVTVCSMTVPVSTSPLPLITYARMFLCRMRFMRVCVFIPLSSDFTPTNEPQTPILSQISDLHFMVPQMLAEKGGF